MVLAPSSDQTATLPLALTMGEPAGIGGEIALHAWRRRREGVPPFYLIDDPERVQRLARSLGWDAPIRQIDRPGRTVSVFAEALPVMPVGGAPIAEPGCPEAVDQRLVVRAIETAVADVRAGRAGGQVDPLDFKIGKGPAGPAAISLVSAAGDGRGHQWSLSAGAGFRGRAHGGPEVWIWYSRYGAET